MQSHEKLQHQIEATFRQRTESSAELYHKALRSMPGGDTRSVTFYRPYPVFMIKGAGCRLHDLDGNTYLDFLNNYTALVHGHAHPHITQAIADQAARGTVYAAPSERQIALAEEITARFAALEQVRFCNSGTEAVMNALRAARAFTGRPRILKMEGGYHGTYDAMEVSVTPGPHGPEWPRGKPEGPGLSPGLVGEVLVMPFNDVETAERIITEYREELAAVIVEPVMGVAGMIPAAADFLQELGRITREYDVLLICDEVMTFRLARGGAQQLYALEPDLTTFGKVIGGGLPVGAFGGRADVMALFDPRQADFIPHSGTFNGNAITMAAGVAALELLTADAIARLNALGDRLRDGIQACLGALGVTGCVTGLGSLIHVHLGAHEVRDYRAAARGNREVWPWLHLALLNRGVFAARRGMFNVSTAMDEGDIDQAITAFREALEQVLPLLVHG